MKSRFLDKRNCHALLPMGHGLPTLQRLEECLRQINDKQGAYRGLIDKLIRQNKDTIHKARGAQRLLPIHIDIAQGLNISERSVRTEVREMPRRDPVLLHTFIEPEEGVSWKTMIPLQFLLKGWGDANAGHQCYVHSISKGLPRIGSIEQMMALQQRDDNSYYYVGITGRNWLERLSEHMAATRRGTKRRFYEALRESVGWQDVLYSSSLIDINLTYEDAMNWEEMYVDRVANDQYGLNMIPGGFKGLQYLHKLGVTKKVNVSLEEREQAISEFIRQNPRKGIPNPFVKEWWEDDEHYEQVNEANPKRLSVDQRKEIVRLHSEGVPVSEIAKQIGALNEKQVQKFLSGKTYKRGAVKVD